MDLRQFGASQQTPVLNMNSVILQIDNILTRKVCGTRRYADQMSVPMIHRCYRMMVIAGTAQSTKKVPVMEEMVEAAVLIPVHPVRYLTGMVLV